MNASETEESKNLPFPSITVDLDDDPVRLEDLLQQGTEFMQARCIYCNYTLHDHGITDEVPEHEHRFTDIPVCRRLHECRMNDREGRLFYTYQNLDELDKYAIVRVTEGSAESVDDTEVIQFGRKKLAEEVKPMWRFKTKLAAKKDFTEYLSENLVIGLEMELDFKNSDNPPTDNKLTQLFGVHPSEYHHHPQCPVCGSSSCWNHLPENLIRGIEHDSSINGWEFLVYGSHISSEEFAKRLPLAKFKEHFTINERDGLHVHAMLVHDIALLPNVIVKNLWQLFRYYYPAWVSLFGNYSEAQGFLRRSSHGGHDYVKFVTFNKSPFLSRWARDVTDRDRARCALWLDKTPVDEDEMHSFDIEIRTPDGTFDMEQLLALRSLTKAIILRSAQLSTFGLISVESNEKGWDEVKRVVSHINNREGITKDDEMFMRSNTLAFLRELSPFLTELERKCVKNLIDRPVRDREGRMATAQDIVPDISETAKQLKKLITLSQTESDNENEWFSKMAKIMGLNISEVKSALRQLKAFYDTDSKTMVVIG